MAAPDDFTVGPASQWFERIKRYRTAYSHWQKSGDVIVERYRLAKKMARAPLDGVPRDTSTTRSNSYNVLWSIVQTMRPALYSRPPQIVAERQHKDPDVIGRLAASVLQRAATIQIKRAKLGDALNACVLDVLLVGRGVPWVRYDSESLADEPVSRFVDPETDAEGFINAAGRSSAGRKDLYFANDEDRNAIGADEDLSAGDRSLMRRVNGFASQTIHCDYVHWKDFAHAPLRNWQEVMDRGWVARRVAMTAKEGLERWGEMFLDASLSSERPTEDAELNRGSDRSQDSTRDGEAEWAEVWEIWDVPTSSRIMIAKGVSDLLEQEDDPYGVDGFFPCPMPAYATTTNEDLIPTPDYVEYSELAEKLDRIDGRINRLTEALKMAGFYDASVEGVGDYENIPDGKLKPIRNAAAVEARGGIANAITWIPVDKIAAALDYLEAQSERTKNKLYEVSGISDIVRGQVDPREKAYQTKTKAQYAQSRIDQRRRAVERVSRDAVRIVAEMTVELFEPDRLRQQSSFDKLPEIQELRERHAAVLQQHQQAAAAFQQTQGMPPQVDPQTGQPAPPPQDPGPAPEDPVERLWGQILELLHNDRLRDFEIDVETDSSVEMDSGMESEQRMAFLGAAGEYLHKAGQVVAQAPALAKPAMELMQFAIRGFRAGRTIEAAFEQGADALEAHLQQQQQAAQQQQGQPDPKAQAEAQRVQQQTQLDGQKAAADLERIRVEGAAAQEKARADIAQATAKAASDQQRAQIDLDTAHVELEIKQVDLEIRKAQLAAAQMPPPPPVQGDLPIGEPA